ncbi:MAG: phosphoribosylamine--glycine ligase [Alphaproteobacteria bacterium]|nr:phosphoribosylamine--glycine ligase [Alphaproteobacteria bacterium]
MRILVVGSGGREHALCWAIAASPLCDKLYCAPGNPGIAEEAELVAIAAMELDRIVDFAREKSIDLVVVGPEPPLVAGLVDKLDAAGIKAFGPRAAAAALEGSKGFTKDFCARHKIPTAAYQRFTDAGKASAYVRQKGAPIVVKADGLAAGKGVTVARTVDEALAAVADALVGGRFGSAGASVVVEEFLEGEIASFFALIDGVDVLPLQSVQDHKAVGDGETGPNTGGMGAYAPVAAMTPAMEQQVMDRIVRPTVRAMAAEGAPYKGVLFTELMICRDGPKLIEFNVRFGDPECQVLMMRLKSDLVPALVAACDGELKSFDLRWHADAVLTVVLAAKGYPDTPKPGGAIGGLDRASALPGVKIFQAGTKLDAAGRLVAAGGRVLNVTARAPDVAEAQALAYRAVDLVDFPDGFCRRDIGWRAVPSRAR